MAGRIINATLRRCGALALVLISLAGCVPGTVPTTTAPRPGALPVPPARPAVPVRLDTPQAAAQAFVAVADRIEPLAEAYCRQSAPFGTSCDFQIGVDPNPEAPPNAFQTLDDRQRPVVIFTASLIAMARNADELAFVMSHEVAHHIAGHIPRRMATAERGALLGAVYGQITGADAATIEQLQRVGAALGARQYSKEFELEADALGARIAYAAGFDPLLGAGFFDRLPDPGDRFLGSHPPNAQRRATVRAAVAQVQAGS
ncbi:MAG: M48 family metallopeptidase [Gemmobacter sp.]|uniref:M48 family metallopeptidase n=1 Tax=Gemmobacter sp. TaxID=1898957 RepID=UPI001A5A2826|nr:M48 family metallopeptidase [Gemmobacter sp.]MBL8561832.1 M48 family metallopeptidase [Gemmobacter sp.]